MNRLDIATRTRVISCLLEGCSIRATVRVTGVSKKAVSRLLVDAGAVCADYQDRVFRNLSSRRIQTDELWGFNYCKQKNITPKIASKVPGAGDVWLWVAIDADTKLVPSWLLGARDFETASTFVRDLAGRLAGRTQITRTAIVPIWKRSKMPSAQKSITRSSRSSTGTSQRINAATVLPASVASFRR